MTATIGIAVGLALAVVGVIITAVGDYSREVAFVGQVPNTIGTIPFSLGYMSLIILWSNHGADTWLKKRLRAVGRMALTNYLAQTLIGVIILTTLLADVDIVKPELGVGVRVRGVGPSAMVVSGMAESLLVRAYRMALARRRIQEKRASSAPEGPTNCAIGDVDSSEAGSPASHRNWLAEHRTVIHDNPGPVGAPSPAARQGAVRLGGNHAFDAAKGANCGIQFLLGLLF